MVLLSVTISPLVGRWARASQQGARRNAMLASTDLTRRRIERDEVEDYLAAAAPRTGSARAVGTLR